LQAGVVDTTGVFVWVGGGFVSVGVDVGAGVSVIDGVNEGVLVLVGPSVWVSELVRV
jgi:hypothetical protein